MHSVNWRIVCISPRIQWWIGTTLLKLSAPLKEASEQWGRMSKESLGQVLGGRNHGKQDGLVGAKCSLLHSAYIAL